MTLISAAGRCDFCGKGNNPGAMSDPLPVISGDRAFCSTECRDWYDGRWKPHAAVVEQLIATAQDQGPAPAGLRLVRGGRAGVLAGRDDEP